MSNEREKKTRKDEGVAMSLNIENAQKLVDHLKALPTASDVSVGFEMGTFYGPPWRGGDHSGHECGTVACIAGHAVLLAGRYDAATQTIDEGGKGWAACAQNWLGLTVQVADNLFFGYFSNLPIHKITLDEAVEELERLIAEATLQGSVV